MSQEDVDVVTRIYEEFERGNFWLPDLFDPSIRIDWSDALFAHSAHSAGVDELTADMRELFDAWEHLKATAERIVDAGEQVVVVATWSGRGKTSGVQVEATQGFVWTVRDGKALSVVSYEDPAKALEAVGLSE